MANEQDAEKQIKEEVGSAPTQYGNETRKDAVRHAAEVLGLTGEWEPRKNVYEAGTGFTQPHKKALDEMTNRAASLGFVAEFMPSKALRDEEFAPQAQISRPRDPVTGKRGEPIEYVGDPSEHGYKMPRGNILDAMKEQSQAHLKTFAERIGLMAEFTPAAEGEYVKHLQAAHDDFFRGKTYTRTNPFTREMENSSAQLPEEQVRTVASE